MSRCAACKADDQETFWCEDCKIELCLGCLCIRHPVTMTGPDEINGECPMCLGDVRLEKMFTQAGEQLVVKTEEKR